MNYKQFQDSVKKRASVPRLSDFLAECLDAIGYEQSVALDNLIEHWEDVVGNQVASVAKPKKLEKRVLILSVTTPTWRTELSFMKLDLLSKINDYIGTSTVENIIFR